MLYMIIVTQVIIQPAWTGTRASSWRVCVVSFTSIRTLTLSNTEVATAQCPLLSSAPWSYTCPRWPRCVVILVAQCTDPKQRKWIKKGYREQRRRRGWRRTRKEKANSESPTNSQNLSLIMVSLLTPSCSICWTWIRCHATAIDIYILPADLGVVSSPW